MPTAKRSCPLCHALPVDWVDDPHQAHSALTERLHSATQIIAALKDIVMAPASTVFGKGRAEWRHRAVLWLLNEPGGSEVARPWRPEVRAFADLMEAQLRANDHKPGWRGDQDWELHYRLREEVSELGEQLAPGSRTDLASWRSRVGSEAADVGNFAMMIADVCGALTTSGSSAINLPEDLK
jgi:hypothetical protein